MLLVIYGILFISLIGTINHYLYDMSNHNKFLALFVAVNESVWEHIKLALTPTYLWVIVLLFRYGDYPNFWLSQLISVVTLLFVIPLLFYLYKLFTKKNVFALDICIFYLSIIVSQVFGYYILNLPSAKVMVDYISIICYFILFSIYLIGTIMPPNNHLFTDPISKKSGFLGHTHSKKRK